MPAEYSALIAPLTLWLLVAASSPAQSQASVQSASGRAQVIAARFSKSKHVVKNRRGVRAEKYLDVRSTPAVKANPVGYSGTYEVHDLGFALTLRVDPNGFVEGTGHEPVDHENAIMRSFTLADARIRGALLTGTRVYADGARESFEGAFINKTTSTRPTDTGTAEFGLGVIGKPFRAFGVTFERLFYQPTR